MSIDDVKKHSFFSDINFKTLFLQSSALIKPKVVRSDVKMKKIALYKGEVNNSDQSDSPKTSQRSSSNNEEPVNVISKGDGII